MKNKLDKVDTKLSNLFKNNGFTILKSDKVNLELVDKILKSKNIPVSATTFIDADNMDVVLNDIEKISLLDEEELINVKKYISESFDSNIFELINSILLGDLDEALNKYSHLKENPVAINRIVLKQLDQIRIIKSYPSSFKSELSKRGYSNIHPYRLQLMKKSSINTVIDLNMAVMELMKNDIDKVFNFETSILKIVSTKNN
ncbi:DNA polymerase III subunit delta [Clostridium thermobutyricum DSM 4928]|uniref:DNA polymerase III subunit delta n=1 Tax=Clostridium thermobutyricum DSM 4928 TaxID=1121339 RepID=A0A1V4SNW1_9CLOT|nr:DNA polymerase III subunit delta [Clostridium thermobutyricum DSM 4928]